MILVTGGTGFIGRALIRHLVDSGHEVRTLIRPSSNSPRLPRGVPVNVAVSSLSDERGLRAAMVGVDVVYHLASAEWQGPRGSLMNVDIEGTRAVVQAAEDAGVRHFFFVSHLGADRASAYSVLKAKGVAEEHIRHSSLNYTILRTAMVYGPNDGFSTGLARIMGALPFVFLMPGDGQVLLQPLWVEDLVTCLTWLLDDPESYQGVFEIGGPEYLSFRAIVELIMQETGMKRRPVGLYPPYLKALTIFLDSLLPDLPVSVYWLDYLAVNRTTAIDTLPRVFNLMPARMSQRLSYLRGQNWSRSFMREILKRRT